MSSVEGAPVLATPGQGQPLIASGRIDGVNIEHANMKDNWALADALYGGTPAMRDRTTDYLPQFPKEKQEEYDLRKNRTFLFAMYERSIKALTGFPFSRRIELKDTDKQLIEWSGNINLEGDNIDVFSRRVFESAFKYGHSFIYVDMPVSPVANPSLHDMKNFGLRPYMVHYDPEQIIGWSWVNIRGVPYLTQVRLLEAARVPDPSNPWNQIIVEQIRVLEPGRVSVFQSLTGSNTNTGTHLSTTFTTNSLSPSLPVSAISPRDVSKGQWQLVDQYETIKMPVIPLVPFYTNKIRFMESSPPMLALVW